MGANLRRLVSRRQALKLGAATSTALAGIAAGLVPELVSAKSSGGSDPGRELTRAEVAAYLNTLHAPEADNFAKHLSSLGHEQLASATGGATRILKGHVFVLLELGFSKVGPTGASIYVLLDGSSVSWVGAVRHTFSTDGKLAQELVINAGGAVVDGRSATLHPDSSFTIVNTDGSSRTLTLNEIMAAARKGAAEAKSSPFGVLQAEASTGCTTCQFAAGLVGAIGCGIGVFLASLLCGPGFLLCILLVILLAGTWCWAVFALGGLFTCCDIGYCNWCYDCAYC